MSAPGSASPGYAAALAGAAVADRPERARVRVSGRDPFTMMQGILTSRVPDPPASPDSGIARGRARYAAVLTPKGRLVAELRALRTSRPEDGLLLDLPASAVGGLLAHLAQYLPPRFARAADESALAGALTVAGPAAAALLTREALGLRVDERDLEALAEDEWVGVDLGGSPLIAMRSGELAAEAYDVLADRASAHALRARLLDAGAAPLAPAELEVLRVEAGRPAWGAELDPDTLPPEAGIDARAIDHGKGCYTGQEVIVRIRDRGHVNRHLRGLLLGGEPAAPGTELWAAGRDRPVGVVTSAVRSPRAGGLALGWLRREVEVPGEVRLGGPDGPAARALALDAGVEWWRG